MEIANFPGQEHWNNIKCKLKEELGEDVYESWFARINLEGHSDNTVKLSVPTVFLKQWIRKNYQEFLVGLWKNECNQINSIELNVRGATRPHKGKKSSKSKSVGGRGQAESRSITLPSNQKYSDTASVEKPLPIFSRDDSDLLEGSTIDPKFTFETFVEGKSNSLALAAAREVAECGSVKFNPLFIHSSVGLGKTHLLHAIGNRARWTDRSIVYLTAEHFMYRFVAALQNQTAIAFKDKLRNLDLLLIDDMQFLHGKQIQLEFCHTLNSLIDGAKQVICAADRVPMELTMLDNRMRSRLSGGLLVDIENPDFELRRNMLELRCKLIRRDYPDFDLPSEIIDYVAGVVKTNGRDLEGAMNRLLAHNQYRGIPITMEIAEKSVRDLVRNDEPKQVRIEDIQRIVSKHYSLSRTELLSNRRSQTVVKPRQVAMYLSKTMTARSLPEIGKRFGNRDHTTVLHAVRKIENLMPSDSGLSRDIDLLKQLLEV